MYREYSIQCTIPVAYKHGRRRARFPILLIALALLLPALVGCAEEEYEGVSCAKKAVERDISLERERLTLLADWDEAYTLPFSVPPLSANGLELPVVGATGYTSIEMSLWSEKQGSNTLSGPQTSSVEQEPAETEPDPPKTESPGTESGGSEPTQSGTEPEIASPGVGDTAPPVSPGEEAVAAPTAVRLAYAVKTAQKSGAETARLKAGAAFTVLEESGEWWRVRTESGQTGWVLHRYCMVNLPDVIPSIQYNATNGYSSRFVSSGKALEGITGEALYTGKTYNPRLERDEFMMPVLYTMAKHLAQAQQNALKHGNCIVLIEGYRPYETQRAVANALSRLSQKDAQVRANITKPPWGIGWFIAQGTSNHQQGFAVDVTMAKVEHAELRRVGTYEYVESLALTSYHMPSVIHELSAAAATYTKPVSAYSSEWKTTPYATTMNEPAKALQSYCTAAKLTPLASEWWHFNDPSARAQVEGHRGSGRFEITQCLSQPVA